MHVTAASSPVERRDLARPQPISASHLELIQGTVQNLTFEARDTRASFDVNQRKVQLTVPGGDRIALSEGDVVRLAGRGLEPFRGLIYYNQTTGAGSIPSAHKHSLFLLMAGTAGLLVAAAILLTTILAARTQTLSGISLLLVPVYLVCLIVSGAILVYSSSVVMTAIEVRKVCRAVLAL
jgi:hypothetical protein